MRGHTKFNGVALLFIPLWFTVYTFGKTTLIKLAVYTSAKGKTFWLEWHSIQSKFAANFTYLLQNLGEVRRQISSISTMYLQLQTVSLVFCITEISFSTVNLL